jgi:membrane fusion protein, multidrug efflux system
MRAWLVISFSTLLLASCAQRESPVVSRTTQLKEVTVAPVVAVQLNRQEMLPGDLLAYRDVAIYPKVSGFVDWIGVDRGSAVSAGQLLIRLRAPELEAQTRSGYDQARAAAEKRDEAKSQLEALIEEQKGAEAAHKAERDTFKRLKEASGYAGIIAGNDLEIAEQKMLAGQAKVKAIEKKRSALLSQIRAATDTERSARQSARSTKSIESYLQLTAPFNGVITERNVHEGSFVDASGNGKNQPLLRVQQRNTLRLVVPVPESDVSGIASGALVNFAVSAYPGQTFQGVIRRVAGSLDLSTRTMAVELDVANPDDRLSPGMYAEVSWPVSRSSPSLLVPRTAIVKTTAQTFVIRVNGRTTEWVDVKTGSVADDLVEVFGAIQPGDFVAVKGTDELRPGKQVNAIHASR